MKNKLEKEVYGIAYALSIMIGLFIGDLTCLLFFPISSGKFVVNIALIIFLIVEYFLRSRKLKHEECIENAQKYNQPKELIYKIRHLQSGKFVIVDSLINMAFVPEKTNGTSEHYIDKYIATQQMDSIELFKKPYSVAEPSSALDFEIVPFKLKELKQ